MGKSEKLDKLNSEHYHDLTAYHAVKNIDEANRKLMEKKLEDNIKLHKTLKGIFTIADLSGFEIVNRIILKDKKTGKIWY